MEKECWYCGRVFDGTDGSEVCSLTCGLSMEEKKVKKKIDRPQVDAALEVTTLIRTRVDPEGSDISYREWGKIYEICHCEELTPEQVCEETAAEIWSRVRGVMVEFYRLWADKTWDTEKVRVPKKYWNSLMPTDDAIRWYSGYIGKESDEDLDNLVRVGVYSWHPLD